MRIITLEQAQVTYPGRYTIEHKPEWAERPYSAHFYAPQYATDREWYDNTIFPGEPGVHGNCKHCQSNNPSWPMGRTLTFPFRVERTKNHG